LKSELPVSFYRCLFFAYGDLLQSPDEEILLDICQTLSMVLSESSILIELTFEQGIFSRLKEIFDSLLSTSTTSAMTIKELILCTFSSMIRYSWDYQKRSIFYVINYGKYVFASSRNQTITTSNGSSFVGLWNAALQEVTFASSSKQEILLSYRSIVQLLFTDKINDALQSIYSSGVLVILSQLLSDCPYNLKLDIGKTCALLR
jgi:small-conductance mechanosensitive channel